MKQERRIGSKVEYKRKHVTAEKSATDGPRLEDVVTELISLIHFHPIFFLIGFLALHSI